MKVRIALAALALTSCFRNPVTGNLQLDLMTESQEIAMGQEAKKQVEQSIGLYKNPAIEAYVAELGKGLAAVSGRTQVPFSYEVVDDPAINAFALPGGPIFVTRGILTHLNSEAELAAVMGHETGHVVARHSANQISKGEVAQLGLGVGSILSPTLGALSQAAGAGLQLLFLKFSREDETQADELGFRFMTKDGYDPHTMVNLFKMLGGLGKEAGVSTKMPEYLQTHPDPENRLAATQQRLATELKGDTVGAKIDREKYLAVIDGMTYGEDPRQGYFKGDAFLHPGLKFQFNMPPGWKHQNAPDAVAGMSDKQDAVLQLAPGGKGSPQDAAQKFFSQQGVKQGAAASGTVHGDQAISSYFTGTTQQGEVSGLVTFFSHGGMTYAMLGYTSAAQMAAYDPVFKASMASFGPLTDPAALNAQPARLKIVKLAAPMTVEQFNQRYPSTVPLFSVALINGVDENGTIPAGSAKQVTGGMGPNK